MRSQTGKAAPVAGSHARSPSPHGPSASKSSAAVINVEAIGSSARPPKFVLQDRLEDADVLREQLRDLRAVTLVQRAKLERLPDAGPDS